MEETKVNDTINTPPQEEKPEKTKDEEILELAKKELMRDVKCASIRAEQYGAHSWAKPPNYRPSQRFLKHMLMSNSNHNERREKRQRDITQSDTFKRHSDYITQDSKKKRRNDLNDRSHSKHKHNDKR
ncbi:uncharacterized protein [Parasteatoda tepidariorum]|uniref:uncharacterized protein n=1 Tax=Parasteatoda tepidariorum TaxID=114398 RepID=UPI001C722FCE|nr:uncharacterized protein LOC107437169 [Parasteatoda tepidariorum]